MPGPRHIPPELLEAARTGELTRRNTAKGTFARSAVDRAIYERRQTLHPGTTARAALGHHLRPRHVSQANVFDLSARDQASRQRATRALGHMRHDGLSLSRAAQREGTSADTVRRWVASGLEQDRAGRWKAKPTDDVPRIVPIVSGGTVYPRVAVSYGDARIISPYLQALRRYLSGEDEEALAPFAGVVVRGTLPDGKTRDFELEADPETVSALAFMGLLDDLVVGS